MSETKMTIIKAPEHEVPVESWECQVPGLVVTVIPVTEIETGYRITHEASGIAIAKQSFPSIPVAKLFADRVKDYAKWNMSTDEIQALSGKKLDTLREKLDAAATDIANKLETDASSIIAESMKFDG